MMGIQLFPYTLLCIYALINLSHYFMYIFNVLYAYLLYIKLCKLQDVVISLLKFLLIQPHIYLWHCSSIPMVLSVIVSNERKYSCSISLITTLHSWLSSNFGLSEKFTLSLFMNDIFTGYWILGRHFKDVSPLFAGFYCFFGESFFEGNMPLFLASFTLFCGCLYNFPLCLCFWQFY